MTNQSQLDKMKLEELQTNPDNPRLISEVKTEKLIKSLLSLPKMMKIRPMVLNNDKDKISQAGNMRLTALKIISDWTNEELQDRINELPIDDDRRKESLKIFKKIIKSGEIPNDWVSYADNYTEDELKEFIIKDNISYGAWDWEKIHDDWSQQQLEDWGMEIPPWTSGDYDDEMGVSYDSDNIEEENSTKIVFYVDAERYDEVIIEIDEFSKKIGCEYEVKGQKG